MALSFVIISISCALLSSLIALGADRYPLLLRWGSFILLGITGIFAILGGGITLLNNITIHTEFYLGLPWLPWHVSLDPLSALFITIIGIVTTTISIYAPSYVREFERGHYSLSVLGFFTGLFIASMLLVLLAADAFMFMIAWELMSLSSYFLVIYQHLQPANRRAGFLYLLMAHVGGLAILLAFAILVSFSNNFTFDAMQQAALPFNWATITFSLALFGFGMKAGLFPIHVWLPEAHPVAPSHISALMSGVMLKIAIYGLVRMIFDLLGIELLHWSWGLALIILGGASALLGILYALMQNDLKRLLAYSSIENIGIICVGLGLSILFIATNHLFIGALGLIAALYHAFNHALFKSLLFLSAGAIIHTTHERNLENMGGLIHRLPYTAFFTLVGCLSIASLPPFNGFVSEWLTFQTALQAPSLESGVLRVIVPFSAALLALTGALSATCFVKMYGIAFLGQARDHHLRHVHEVTLGMRISLGILATCCLLFGILPTTVITLLDTIAQHLLHSGLPNTSIEGWLWLTPISPHVASYSAPLVLLFIVTVWTLSYLLLHGHKLIRRRRAHPWDCGFGQEGNVRTQYSATAFAMPIRRIFHPIWIVEEHIEERKDETLYNTEVRYHLNIRDRSAPILYEPIGHWVMSIARQFSRIQTGNIRIYLAYSFFTLLILLWLITFT